MHLCPVFRYTFYSKILVPIPRKLGSRDFRRTHFAHKKTCELKQMKYVKLGKLDCLVDMSIATYKISKN